MATPDGALKYADVPMPSVRDAIPQTPAIAVTDVEEMLTKRIVWVNQSPCVGTNTHAKRNKLAGGGNQSSPQVRSHSSFGQLRPAH